MPTKKLETNFISLKSKAVMKEVTKLANRRNTVVGEWLPRSVRLVGSEKKQRLSILK